ncbi:MAG: hypothetical protein WBL45_10245 [Solirubrobacterales bacterium]
MARHAQLPKPLPWRGVAVYLLILCLAGVGLGILGGLTEWSDGIAFAVTVVVGTPIAFAAIHDTLSWLRGSREGRRAGRRPSA